jgi:hypothetical protein
MPRQDDGATAAAFEKAAVKKIIAPHQISGETTPESSLLPLFTRLPEQPLCHLRLAPAGEVVEVGRLRHAAREGLGGAVKLRLHNLDHAPGGGWGTGLAKCACASGSKGSRSIFSLLDAFPALPAPATHPPVDVWCEDAQHKVHEEGGDEGDVGIDVNLQPRGKGGRGVEDF